MGQDLLWYLWFCPCSRIKMLYFFILCFVVFYLFTKYIKHIIELLLCFTVFYHIYQTLSKHYRSIFLSWMCITWCNGVRMDRPFGLDQVELGVFYISGLNKFFLLEMFINFYFSPYNFVSVDFNHYNFKSSRISLYIVITWCGGRNPRQHCHMNAMLAPRKK